MSRKDIDVWNSKEHTTLIIKGQEVLGLINPTAQHNNQQDVKIINKKNILLRTTKPYSRIYRSM
jgi:hypothetical protein